ncbi:hypothetical protein [Candidatus Uabimicrobium amorphum]|uniref:HEAT repeat domain-containing protein n=1 Tax=Uabimicrobium amorphum TaxID=2596890 RepID=A0A5S9IL27_UABAM|nr:hypothetical protein [Candidatus Uabimicrobium amorphum]BBM83511.1 hypothetical protein UABAM_01863 [Candidatus Uabimicrobium amorphum]
MKLYIGQRKYQVNVFIPIVTIITTFILFANIPARQGVAVAIFGILTMFIISLRKFILSKRVSAFLIIYQLLLFCLLHQSIYYGYGTHHYKGLARPAVFFDWLWMVIYHGFRAADIFDFLEAYHINLQTVKSASSFSSGCLIAMHWMLDIFLLTWVLNKRFVESLERYLNLWKPSLAIGFFSFFGVLIFPPIALILFICAFIFVFSVIANIITALRKANTKKMTSATFFILSVGFLLWYALFASSQKWSVIDTLLWWPLDNIIRLLDIGDTFQIMDWHLHSVPKGFWPATLALSFRVLIGIPLAAFVGRIRLKYLGGVIMQPLELLQNMSHTDDTIRQQARNKMHEMLTRSRDSIPELVSDLVFVQNEEIVREALQILEEVHPLWRGNPQNLIELMKELLEENRHDRTVNVLQMIDANWRNGEAIHQLTKYFIEHLKDKRMKIKKYAISSLGNNATQSLPILYDILKQQGTEEICCALEAIARMQQPDSFTKVVVLIAHVDPGIREVALATLDVLDNNWRSTKKNLVRSTLQDRLFRVSGLWYKISRWRTASREKRQLQTVLQELQ